MGNANSSKQKGPPSTEVQKSKDIDATFAAQEPMVHKILLLGAGDSGKTTLFKQLINRYGPGFTQKQMNQYIPSILQNAVLAMLVLVRQSDRFDTSVPPVNPEAKKLFLQLVKDDYSGAPIPELVPVIKDLWADERIQKTYADRAHNFQIYDSAPYFFEKIESIMSANYEPSFEDSVKCQVRTTGLVETKFELSGLVFKVVDTGGQRNERKKWIHGFENVSVVMIVASLSEYDQKLFEDEKTNRMLESMVLFQEICESKWFKKTPIFLVLNKKDIFETKILTSPLSVVFPEYTGGDSAELALEFIQEQFLAHVPEHKDRVRVFFISSTDENSSIRPSNRFKKF
jgi:guanine nucleotide-binding protein G(i) subunit alpha